MASEKMPTVQVYATSQLLLTSLAWSEYFKKLEPITKVAWIKMFKKKKKASTHLAVLILLSSL